MKEILLFVALCAWIVFGVMTFVHYPVEKGYNTLLEK
jgi:hypothetical protein